MPPTLTPEMIAAIAGFREDRINALGEALNSGTGGPGGTGPTGPAGPQGEPGPQGPPGEQGAQGVPGTNGGVGPAGPKGDTGDQGIQGLPGADGAQGAPGADGAPGASGADGDDGLQGIQGIQGPKGDTGDQGIQGIPGTPGTNGTNGADGGQGIQGIQGPQGIQGTQGASGAGAPVVALCTIDRTTTGQVLVDVPDLAVPLLANSTYEFEAILSVASSSTAGNQYAMQFSAALATIEAQISGTLAAATSRADRISVFNTATVAYCIVAAAGAIRMQGIVTTGANAGNLTVRHLKVTSGTSTIRARSYLKALKL